MPRRSPKFGVLMAAAAAGVAVIAAGTNGMTVSEAGASGTSVPNAVIHADTTTSGIASHQVSLSVSDSRPGELLVALVAGDSGNTPHERATVSGGGLGWRLVARSDAQLGTAEIWWAVAPTRLSGLSVTARESTSGATNVAMVVKSFVNASVGAFAKHAALSGAPSVTLVPDGTGSVVFAVGFDWDASVHRTVASGERLQAQWTDSSGDTYWTQRPIATTTAGTAVTVGDIAPTTDAYDLAAVEVMRSTGPPTTTSTAPTSTTIPVTTTDPSGGLPALSVSGNEVLAGGKAVVLKGADLSGTEFVCAQNYTTDPYGGQPLAAVSTFQAMAAWNINVVRIPLNEDCWLGINGVEIGGATYKQAIAAEVAAAHAAGLYVILDLHWSAPGTQRALSQNPEPDADHSVTFWQQVAAAYKNDSGAIFDLYNEPYDYWGTNPDGWAGWLNGDTQSEYVTGGSPYTVSTDWKTAGMQQLVTAIRGTGATNPVLVNGLDWANDDSGWLSHAPVDPLHQLIVGAHIYPGESCSTSSCWAGVFPAIKAAGYPVLIGETGDASTSAADANQCDWLTKSFFSYADAQGWNYLAWTWNVWSNSDDVLVTSWSGTPTSGEGAEWRAHLLAGG